MASDPQAIVPGLVTYSGSLQIILLKPSHLVWGGGLEGSWLRLLSLGSRVGPISHWLRSVFCLVKGWVEWAIEPPSTCPRGRCEVGTGSTPGTRPLPGDGGQGCLCCVPLYRASLWACKGLAWRGQVQVQTHTADSRLHPHRAIPHTRDAHSVPWQMGSPAPASLCPELPV